MQVEFRELKEQVNSIDERFFNDSDSVDTVQNNLDQSEKLITLNKSRLANVVLQTKSKLKTAGKNALLSFAEKIHVPKALASLQKGGKGNAAYAGFSRCTIPAAERCKAGRTRCFQ